MPLGRILAQEIENLEIYQKPLRIASGFFHYLQNGKGLTLSDIQGGLLIMEYLQRIPDIRIIRHS